MTTLTELSRRLNFTGRPRHLPSLILITERSVLPDPIAVMDNLNVGDAVLLRDYELPDRADLAHQLRAATTVRRLRLIIAADVSLAIAVKADGVHLPEWALTPTGGAARRWHRGDPRRLLTIAAHTPTGLRRAARIGADAALLAPVFPTNSHPGAATIGPIRFAVWQRQSPVPVYALGGVSGATAPRLAASGATGFATISGFDPPVSRPAT